MYTKVFELLPTCTIGNCEIFCVKSTKLEGPRILIFFYFFFFLQIQRCEKIKILHCGQIGQPNKKLDFLKLNCSMVEEEQPKTL